MKESPLVTKLRQHITLAQLPAPAVEHTFHPVRKWRFDLAWTDQRLACEVEGGTWSGGRHTRGVGFERDCEKYAEALLLGWRVLRVTGDMVHDGRALAFIERALQKESL